MMFGMKPTSRAGIYAIIHVATGRRYVGSTGDVAGRLRAHCKDLRGGRHHCRHLQNAWNKYGEAAFGFEVLEECPCEAKVLLAREQAWIDTFKGQLFNARPFAEQICREWLQTEDGKAWLEENGRKKSEWWAARPERRYRCERCREPFRSRDVKVPRFCSLACRVLFKAENQYAETRACEQCGVPFRCSRYAPDRFCSRSCAIRNRHAANREAKGPVPEIEKTCLHCGGPFRVPDTLRRRGRVFCSRSCGAKHRGLGGDRRSTVARRAR
jgi:hypothetical protein